MVSKICIQAFQIDKVGNRWMIRISFVLLTLLNFFFMMFPLGDSDFTPLMEFYSDYLDDPQRYLLADRLEIPISSGNLIFLGASLLMVFVLCCISILYFASFFKYSVVDSKITGGRVIVTLLLFLVFFPLLLLIYSALSFFSFIVVPPFCLIVASFLSGDFSFGRSFANGFRLLRTNLISVYFNFITVLFGLSILDYFLTTIAVNNAYYSIVCVLASAIRVFSMMVIGRLTVCIYIDGILKTTRPQNRATEEQ